MGRLTRSAIAIALSIAACGSPDSPGSRSTSPQYTGASDQEAAPNQARPNSEEAVVTNKFTSTTTNALKSAAESTDQESRPTRLAPARLIAKPDYKFANNKLILTVNDQGQIRVSAIQSRVDYETVFTGRLPTHISIQGTEFVLDSHFFNEHFPPSLTVDGSIHADFERINASQYSLLTTPEILQALADGESAVLSYATDLQGKGQFVTFRIESLKGADGEQVLRQARLKTTPENARTLVARAFDHNNSWKVKASRLRAIANARGDGAFVHIPTFTVGAHERHPVWFVVEDSIFALNSPSKTLTPEAPWVRERPDINWAATGYPNGEVMAKDGFDM